MITGLASRHDDHLFNSGVLGRPVQQLSKLCSDGTVADDIRRWSNDLRHSGCLTPCRHNPAAPERLMQPMCERRQRSLHRPSLISFHRLTNASVASCFTLRGGPLTRPRRDRPAYLACPSAARLRGVGGGVGFCAISNPTTVSEEDGTINNLTGQLLKVTQRPRREQ